MTVTASSSVMVLPDGTGRQIAPDEDSSRAEHTPPPSGRRAAS